MNIYLSKVNKLAYIDQHTSLSTNVQSVSKYNLNFFLLKKKLEYGSRSKFDKLFVQLKTLFVYSFLYQLF